MKAVNINDNDEESVREWKEASKIVSDAKGIVEDNVIKMQNEYMDTLGDQVLSIKIKISHDKKKRQA